MSEIKHLETAEWIWCQAEVQPNQYAQFLQDFSSDGKAATLYIAADMNYAVFVNGRYVPGFAYSDYPEQRSVDALDLSVYLAEGRNRLCVVGYCQGITSSTYKAGTPAVRFAVYAGDRLVAASGIQTLARQAPDYVSGPVECISAQLSYSFRYDARQNDGWLSLDYRPSEAWKPAAIGVSSAEIIQRPIKQLVMQAPRPAVIQTYGRFRECGTDSNSPCGKRMQQAALSFCGRVTANGKPRCLPAEEGIALSVEQGDGIYVLLDLQEETAGLLTLDLELPQEAEILIGFGEHLDDLRVRTDVGGRQFCAVYHGVPGRQRFTHYHKRLGCRYLQLHIYASSVKLHYAGLLPTQYPLDEATAAPCDDRLLSAIYRTGVHTLQTCVHEHYEDCPWREQALYAMDSRIQMLCGYYAFREFAVPRATIALLGKGLRQDGLLEMCAPTCRPRTIPGFSLAFVDCLHDYALYSGDLDFVRQQLPIAQTILQTFRRSRDEQGLLRHTENDDYWYFYEWSDGLNGSWPIRSAAGVYAPLQAMFILAAEKYLSLCQITDTPSAFDDLEGEIVRLRTSCQAFWNEERRVFTTCMDATLPDSELVQALMLCAQVADTQQRSVLLEKLSRPGANGLTAVTLSHSIYKYEALMSEPQRFAAFVADDIARIWGSMLFQGATAFWETEKGAWDFFNAGSLCHGWSAIPVYLLHRYQKDFSTYKR